MSRRAYYLGKKHGRQLNLGVKSMTQAHIALTPPEATTV